MCMINAQIALAQNMLIPARDPPRVIKLRHKSGNCPGAASFAFSFHSFLGKERRLFRAGKGTSGGKHERVAILIRAWMDVESVFFFSLSLSFFIHSDIKFA